MEVIEARLAEEGAGYCNAEP